MKIKKGDIIKTDASERTMVLKANDNAALLFTGNQFIIASNIKPDLENPDLMVWDRGKYYFDFEDVPHLEENVEDGFYIHYDNDTIDVETLTEGMVIADDLAHAYGGDINICLGEDTIAFREWLEFDPEDFFEPEEQFSEEENPIVFENGFYSDWIIDSDWQQFLDLQNNIICNMNLEDEWQQDQ